MHAFNKPTQKFLARLFEGLSVEGSKKVDNEPGTFMALHVERLSESLFSMAHYYEQNGDSVADPDMEIWRDENGIYYPVSLQQNTGHFTRAIEFGENGKVSGVAPSAQKDIVAFASMWVRNLRHQQNL